MCSTDLIVEFAQMEQCIGMLSQFQAVLKAHRVDHKVGMDVFRIAMGSHQHFIARPDLRRKFQCDLMGLLMRDILLRGEGLHILVKADAILFTPCGFGCFKLCDGIQPIAVDTADPTDAHFLIPGLLFLHAVFHDPLHITGTLSSFFDIGDRCQLNHPARYGGLPHRSHVEGR